MNITTRATNFDLTPALHEHVENKFSPFQKFFEKESSHHTSIDTVIGENEIVCEVELGKSVNHHTSGDLFRVDVKIRAPGKQFYAQAESSDLYTAIDLARSQVEREIVSNKGKRLRLFRHGASKIKAMIKRLYTRPS